MKRTATAILTGLAAVVLAGGGMGVAAAVDHPTSSPHVQATVQVTNHHSTVAGHRYGDCRDHGTYQGGPRSHRGGCHIRYGVSGGATGSAASTRYGHHRVWMHHGTRAGQAGRYTPNQRVGYGYSGYDHRGSYRHHGYRGGRDCCHGGWGW